MKHTVTLLDESYGDGFITSEKFVEMLYQDLSRQNPAG